MKRTFYMVCILISVCIGCDCSDTNHSPAPKPFSPGVAGAETISRQTANQTVLNSRQNAITTAVAKVSPAVVGINVTQIQRYIARTPFSDDPFWGQFFQPQEYEQKVKGLGSGFLISSDGQVLTNEHVIENASEIIITTTDGKQYKAELAGKDFTCDVALLKIKGTNFPYIPLGNSDDVLIGEWVIALGNPFGLFEVNSKPTVTVGVVSADGLNFKGGLQIEGRSYDNMIQTDAAINGGNSGGPLVNGLGECIGINTFIISGSEYQKTSVGIGFAIPINRIRKILPDLKRLGRVDRPLKIGFRFRNLSAAETASRGINEQVGVLIVSVDPDSKADDTGLKSGDVIMYVDDNPIHSENEFREAIREIQNRGADHYKITVYRRGRLYEAVLPFE